MVLASANVETNLRLELPPVGLATRNDNFVLVEKSVRYVNASLSSLETN